MKIIKKKKKKKEVLSLIEINVDGLVVLLIFRIHSHVMSFVFFTSEHIQNIGQVPTIGKLSMVTDGAGPILNRCA